MRVFATYNIKGGVGKTATAVNLAYLSARGGARTLLWDLDPQGAATYSFRVKAKIKGGCKRLLQGEKSLQTPIRGTDFDDLDLLPADFSYRKLDLFLDRSRKSKKQLAQLLKPLARDYDHLFIDCAPSISLVSEGVFRAADVLLVPTIPTTLSLLTLRQLAKHIRKSHAGPLQVLPFFCMVDRRKSLHRTICEESSQDPFELLRTTIPYSSLVEQMSLRREPLSAFSRNSSPARAYEELWKEIGLRVGG